VICVALSQKASFLNDPTRQAAYSQRREPPRKRIRRGPKFRQVSRPGPAAGGFSQAQLSNFDNSAMDSPAALVSGGS
jgi:hypothetical protein